MIELVAVLDIDIHLDVLQLRRVKGRRLRERLIEDNLILGTDDPDRRGLACRLVREDTNGILAAFQDVILAETQRLTCIYRPA